VPSSATDSHDTAPCSNSHASGVFVNS
jgi:hypothetical protein